MRIRIRGPTGQSTIVLDENATVRDLQAQISKETSLQSFDIKYGYPAKPLLLDQLEPSKKLSELSIKLNGEQLTVSKKEARARSRQEPTARTLVEQSAAASSPSASNGGDGEISLPGQTPSGTVSAQKSELGSTGSFSFDGFGEAPAVASVSKPTPQQNSATAPQAPLSLNRKRNVDVEKDPPEIPVPEMSGTLLLRIMPDDNSCLFRAIGNAVLGGMDTMTELRSIVAQAIQDQPDVYTQVVLEQKPDDYCRWIQTEDAWGGGIELSILSAHFDIEICSIDVQTLRVDRFNEGKPLRCIVVYSGIHYDSIALSPSDAPYTHAHAPPEFDTKQFDAADSMILDKAIALCQVLQGKHYFTDTAAFSIRCNICGGMFVGEKGATEHATQTGHYDFGEAG